MTRGSSGILNIRGSPDGPLCLFNEATSSFRISASSVIVRNFQMRKTVSRCPRRTWRKNTGPGESSLIAIAIAAKTGASSTSPNTDSAMSSQRLSTSADGWSRSCGSPISGSPSAVCISTPGPSVSNRRGTMSI